MWTAFLLKLKGWRTIIVNAVIGLPALVLALLDELKAVDISPLLPPSFGVKIIAAMTVAAIVLRFLTTGPVGHKDG